MAVADANAFCINVLSPMPPLDTTPADVMRWPAASDSQNEGLHLAREDTKMVEPGTQPGEG